MADNATEMMGGTECLSSPISADFVSRWELRYDTRKYPVDFYLRYIAGAREAKDPEKLKGALVALLHWKDGKALSFVPGDLHAKPNTVEPVVALKGSSLEGFARSFHALIRADKVDLGQHTEDLRRGLATMWNSVVIPAFLLHVARPDRLPIIDQHTVRAFLYLTRGRFVKKPTVTWDLWVDYVGFFQEAAVHSGFDSDSVTRCYVDRALFAYGKSLKEGVKSMQLQKCSPAPRDGIT